MDVTKMRFPFGKCAACGKEFNPELRYEHDITHCPWCGELILDYLHDAYPPPGLLKKPDVNNFIYCEGCGTRIFERDGKAGDWIEGANGKNPGVCSGPCERELCGNCADWDVNGECEQCRNSPCGQCPNHDAVETCQNCEHLPERKKWADYIPPETCLDCPKKDCNETPSTCNNPCASCPMENDCYNDHTDVRSYCVAFSKFQEEVNCEQDS
ncbi:MAG: hypothetical protein LBC76_08015 [Treponema sp.]|nr:hypothetical protein [Treponema sp.]